MHDAEREQFYEAFKQSLGWSERALPATREFLVALYRATTSPFSSGAENLDHLAALVYSLDPAQLVETCLFLDRSHVLQEVERLKP